MAREPLVEKHVCKQCVVHMYSILVIACCANRIVRFVLAAEYPLLMYSVFVYEDISVARKVNAQGESPVQFTAFSDAENGFLVR
jgi:hypothetical protein